MTGSMYEGLGYTPNGVQSAATKPVSGESIVTFLERMDAIAEHGTKVGYEAGCRGSHCPGRDAVGMSCSQASIRYAGDMGYRRRVDAGLTAEQIWVEDQAANVVMPKVNTKDTRTVEHWADGQVTVEDSVEGIDDEVDEPKKKLDSYVAKVVAEAPPLTDEQRKTLKALLAPQTVPAHPVQEVTVQVAADRPGAPRGPRWAVRKVWVAVSPDGKLHGPHESREAAFAVVESALRPKARPAGRKMTDEKLDRLRELHGQGLSDSGIAREIGISQPVVSSYRRQLGLVSASKYAKGAGS